MNTTDYQLETLRARFAARGYQPLNRRRVTPEQWIGYGLLTAMGVIPAIAAILIKTIS